MGEYRVGHVNRPSREWEVWDERWLRDRPWPRNGVDTDDRWVIHHPIELDGAACFCGLEFETLDEALAFIAQFERDYAEELAEYRHRTLKVGDRVVPRRNMRGFAHKSHVGRDDLVVLYVHPDDPKLVGVGPIGNDPNLPHSSTHGWLAYLAEDLIRVDG